MRRIFLIGNGESLNRTPLDLLKDEDTFALNGIDRIFDKTLWRPTYYFCTDINPKDPHWEEAIRANAGAEQLFLSDDLKGTFDYANIEWIPACKHGDYAADNYVKRAQSWHLPTICTAFGSMYPMLQIAALMGYDEIYLVGCDNFPGHFDPAYGDWADDQARNIAQNWLHEVSRRSSPVPIYNATIGGTLEVYPRVDLYEILKGKEYA